MKIKLESIDKELTMDEAKSLFNELKDLFSYDSTKEYIPYPVYPQSDWWPYDIITYHH